jgi:cobalt-zinc-cadmium resistance protein CzcA
MPMDASDMMVILKDKKEWTSASTFPALAEKMGKELEAIPGVTAGFQFPVQMRFNELMTGARQDVVCKIYGEDLDTLALYAKKLGALAATVEGAKNIYVETVTGMPQILIEYNRAAMAQFGLNIEEVNRVVNTAFAGESSGLVYEGEKRFDMVVRLNGEQRKNIEDAQNLLIPTPKGTQIPLYQVANVSLKDGPLQIQREDTKRRIIVGFNVGGRDVQTIVTELQKKIDSQIKFPAGYYITYGGAFENLNAAKQRLSIAVPVALLLIFLLLYFSFNSIKQGLLIYSAIPLSAIGGIFGLALRGMPFSISAGVGFIALFGVAVLNGIVLIAEFNRLKSEGWTDVRKIVLMGTKIRLRPVVMTGFVASLGFLPMAISNGSGAEVQRPLATVVIGGLLFATLLTLFILPILYILFENGISFGKSKAKGVVVSIVLILICFSSSMQAQQPISLKAAIDTAYKNNLSIRNEQLQSDYLKKMKGAAWDIPQTSVTAEYGQINSIYKDTKFGVSQSIRFPLVYARQQAMMNEEWKSGIINVSWKQNEIKKEVSQLFYSLLYLQQKRALLFQTDSLYALFLKNASLRFSKGESNVLEKATAETQRGQIQEQLLQIEQDFSVLLLQFKLVLNTDKDFVPETTVAKLPLAVSKDTNLLQQHPYIKSLQQQEQISLSNKKLEQSKLAPDLFLGYANQSIIGLQNIAGVEKNFTATNRFSSVQVGIGLPIFFSGQHARIAAAEIDRKIALSKYEAGLKEMNAKYLQAWLQMLKNQQHVEYYETTALKNATVILQTAQSQFKNGDINYLEWVLLTNQAISIQSEYSDAVKNLNQSIIEINSLTNQ